MNAVRTTKPKRSEAQWTEREQEMAKRHEVGPKTVRAIVEIAETSVDKHLDAIKGLLEFAHGRKLARAPGEEPAAAGGAAAVEYGPDEPISEITKKKLKGFFYSLETRAKLAILLYERIEALDGINFEQRKPQEKRLLQQIEDDMTEAVLACRDPELAWFKSAWQSAQMIIEET